MRHIDMQRYADNPLYRLEALDVRLDYEQRDQVAQLGFKLAAAESLRRLEETEAQIKLALKPKPRWLPEWLYRRIIGRLLVIERLQGMPRL